MNVIEQVYQDLIEKIEKMSVVELDEKLEKNQQTSGPTVAQFLQDYVDSGAKHTNKVDKKCLLSTEDQL